MTYPTRSRTIHAESLGDELCLYDWKRQRVHSLNRTTAFVWQRCDGGTSPEQMAAELREQLDVAEAEALVTLSLERLVRARLVQAPPERTRQRSALTRRDLLQRGVAAALIPTICSLVAPPPAAAQSAPSAPTLTDIDPAVGAPGATVMVTLTGTNFVIGDTVVEVSDAGVAPLNVIVASATSLTADFQIDALAALGNRLVRVTTDGGTSNPLIFTVAVI